MTAWKDPARRCFRPLVRCDRDLGDSLGSGRAALALRLGIFMLAFEPVLRKRPGNVPCKFRPADKKRWTSGHGVWVSDVFAWGGSTAAWKSDLAWAAAASARPADDEERKKLHRLGDAPLIASLALAEGGTVEVAARREHRAELLGPFTTTAADLAAERRYTANEAS